MRKSSMMSSGHTFGFVRSTLEKELRDQIKGLRKTEQAAAIGKLIAQRALEKV